jgi:hypothetical protein
MVKDDPTGARIGESMGPQYDGLFEPDFTDGVLDRITANQFLSCLTPKEHDTIVLWSEGKTLSQIAYYISLQYEGRTPETCLSGRAMGVRVHKILRKLREYAEMLQKKGLI